MTRNRRLVPLIGMLDRLERGALGELEQALAILLAPQATAADRREAELGALAALLIPESGDGSRMRIPRVEYDRKRPREAPASKTLVERYGSWVAVCEAAAALNGHGTRQPWPQPARGRRAAPRYTRDEVLRAVRRCALTVGRRPTTNIYYSWVAERRQRARESGAEVPRLPLQASVERHFRSWDAVRAALGWS